MPPAPLQVLLAAPAGVPDDDLVAALAAAGVPFERVEAAWPEGFDFDRAAGLILTVGGVRAAVAQTRLWRAELGDRVFPIFWVLPEASADATAAGLDAGADICLTRPIDPGVLAAQVRAAGRVREQAAKLAGRAAEARSANEQLLDRYDREAADRRLAWAVQRAGRPERLPTVGPVRFAVACGPDADEAGGWFDVTRLDDDHVGFWVADPGGASLTGGLIGLLIRQTAAGREVTDAGPRFVPPAEVLSRVNHHLTRLDLDPPPLVGLGCGRVSSAGAVTLARAGVPPAVLLPAARPAELWTGPAPFLGAFDAEFATQDGRLAPGDKLVLVTAGNPDQLLAATGASAGLPARPLAEAVRAALLADGSFPEATVLVVEMTA